MTEAIGILGGTFDPIHNGHLQPALDVVDKLGLSHIRLIPNAVPPHRPQPQASAEQRLFMLQLAVNGSDKFKIDTRELARQGESYTVDTLLSLRQDFPNNPLYLLMGTDAFGHIQTWHCWQQLLELAHIVVMKRPGQHLAMSEQLASWYQNNLASEGDNTLSQGKIWPVDVTQLMISATDIRSMFAQGVTPQDLLPDPVIQFIQQANIYRRIQ